MSDDSIVLHLQDDEPWSLTLEGYEGPLHVLLTLARRQQIDLQSLSIQQLAQQYQNFLESARQQNLVLAFSYLVMAAHLAYLKSRLLLPVQEDEDEEDSEETLTFKLLRLQSMRAAASWLAARKQAGEDFFYRTQGPRDVLYRTIHKDTLWDILKAHDAVQERARERQGLTIKPLDLFSPEEALHRIQALTLTPEQTMRFEEVLEDLEFSSPMFYRSCITTHFAALLELARQGRIHVHQSEPYTSIVLSGVPAPQKHRPQNIDPEH